MAGTGLSTPGGAPLSLAALAALAALVALAIACAPETPFATCSSDSDCVAEEYCSSGGLCRPRVVGEGEAGDAREDGQDAADAPGDDGAASDGGGEDGDGDADADADDGEADLPPDQFADLPADIADTDGLDLSVDASCADAASRNACGGCGVLPANEAAPCGQCGDGVWTCTGDGTLVCVGARRLNACGTCAELAARPGAPCGCDDAETVWTCDAETGAFVECLGPAPPNACGGCATLAEEVGAVCLCGGEGAATWRCDGADAVACSDGDDEVETARPYSASFDVFQYRAVGVPGPVEGHLDGVDDVDWYGTGQVVDVAFSNMVPRATLVADPLGAVDYELCFFYRLTHRRPLRDLAATGYGCGDGARCAWLDASEAEDEGDVRRQLASLRCSRRCYSGRCVPRCCSPALASRRGRLRPRLRPDRCR
jgi:hypothetical protein